MKCEQIQSNFSAFQEKQLDVAMKAKIEDHLTACTSCNETWRAFQITWTELESIPIVEAPVLLHARIMESIDFTDTSSQPWYEQFLAKFKFLVKQPVAIGATACAIIAALIGFRITGTQQASLAPSLFSHSQTIGIANAQAVWLATHNGTLQVIITANQAGSGDLVQKVTLERIMPDNLITVVSSANVDLSRGQSRKIELAGADPNDLSEYKLIITAPNGKSTPVNISNLP